MQFTYESIIFKQVMEEKNNSKEISEKDFHARENRSIEYILEGQLCPNCGFARLKREPGNIVRCPICGYGNGAGCT
jgi:hypothetical protein